MDQSAFGNINPQPAASPPPTKTQRLRALLKKKYVLISIGVVLVLAIVLIVAEVLGASPRTLEVEKGRLSGAITSVKDASASGGAYAEIGSQNNGSFQPKAPFYSAFYYAWYGSDQDRNSYWADRGHKPPENWFANYLPDIDPNTFDPAKELYNTKDDAALYWQLQKMKEAKIEVAISSWWGQNRKEDSAFSKIVTDVMNRPDNPYPNLRWAMYYEQEGFGNPSVETIVNDINYIKTKYASQPSMLKIDGKPVIFVYGDDNDGAETAERWRKVREQTGIYTVLKVYPGFESSEQHANSWHQYAPAVRGGQHKNHSYFVSPGFWKDGDAVRLPRNLNEFRGEVSKMVEADATWKLIQTWNEWGEGTSVEPGEQVIQTTNGAAKIDPNGAPFKNKYVDVLKELLPDLEGSYSLTYVAPNEGEALASAGGNASSVLAATTNAGRGFTFTAGGDLGADQPDTIASLDKINQVGSSFFLALGDMSYNDMTPETAWCNFVKSRVGANFPFQLVTGNHEDDDKVDGYIGEFRKCLPDRMNSTGQYGAEYYFDYPTTSPLARMIMIGAGNDFLGEKYDYIKGNKHYNWLAEKIDAARASGIKWIVVGMHKPCITTGNKNCESGEDLMDLLIEKKVDLVLFGHDHDYQRTKQLSCADANKFRSECVADSDNDMKQGAGTVLAITGHFGGGGFTPVDPRDNEAGYFAAIMGGSGAYNLVNGSSTKSVGRGLTKIDITETSLTAEMMVTSRASGSGDFFSDKFVISNGNTTPTPIGDTSPPSVKITSPSANSIATGTLGVKVDASDDKGVTKVEFLIDNVVRSVDTTSPFEYSWNTVSYPNGVHSVIARAFDAAGNVSVSDTVNVTTKNATAEACRETAPSYARSVMNVSVTDKADYHTWLRLAAAKAGKYNVWVKVDNGCAQRYEVSLEANKWIWTKTTADQSKPGIFNLTSGSHEVSISSDAHGLRADSIMLTSDARCTPVELGLNCVNVKDTATPETGVLSPADKSIVKANTQLIASAKDNVSISKVEFFANDSYIGTAASLNEGFVLGWDTTRFDDGTYTVFSRAHDASGNTKDSAKVSVVIDNHPDSPAPNPTPAPGPTPAPNPNPTPAPGPTPAPNPKPTPAPGPTPSPTPPVGSGTYTLSYIAAADATIDEDEKDNIGKSSKLESDGSPNKAFYLKFVPDGINGRKVVSAQIFLYNTNSSPMGGFFSEVKDDNWSENKITWANAPVSEPSFFKLGEVDNGRWYSVDVSKFVTQDGAYSFKVNSNISNGADYSSRETSKQPKLVLIVQ